MKANKFYNFNKVSKKSRCATITPAGSWTYDVNIPSSSDAWLIVTFYKIPFLWSKCYHNMIGCSPCPYVPVHTHMCPYMPLGAPMCPYVLLHATTCPYMPLCAATSPYVPLCALTCPNIPHLYTETWLVASPHPILNAKFQPITIHKN